MHSQDCTDVVIFVYILLIYSDVADVAFLIFLFVEADGGFKRELRSHAVV